MVQITVSREEIFRSSIRGSTVSRVEGGKGNGISRIGSGVMGPAQGKCGASSRRTKICGALLLPGLVDGESRCRDVEHRH